MPSKPFQGPFGGVRAGLGFEDEVSISSGLREEKELRAGRRLVWKEEKGSRGEGCIPVGAGAVMGNELGQQHEGPNQRGLEAAGALSELKLRWKCVFEK